MKAHIDEKGTLHITAENGLESYALDKWSRAYFENYRPSSNNNSEALLIILFREEKE